MVARRPPGKASAALAALASALVLITGCGVIRGATSTIVALDKAGFSTANIEPAGSDAWLVTVERDSEDLDAAAAEAAAVVWRKLPLRIERLEVRCGNGFGGKGTFGADRDDLEQRFGPRDPELDRGIQRSDVRVIALVLAGLFVGGLVLLAGIAVLVVVLVRRSRRRNPPPGPRPPGGPGGTGAWGGEVSQPPPPRYGPPA